MKYAVLFRGINVGGKNIVAMKELERLLSDLGLYKAKTYIQSGNAVFESELSEAELLDLIKSGFLKRFGFESNVLIRSIDEIRVITEEFPMTAEEIAEAEAFDPQVEHLYIYFLETAPEQSQIEAICGENIENDILRYGKREVYLLCHQSIRLAKLAARTSKSFPSATVRNYKTVSRLYELMKNL